MRNIFSCLREWGIYFYFQQNISSNSGAVVTSCTLLKTNPHLYPAVGVGVGGLLDWRITQHSAQLRLTLTFAGR